jgi:hypothetical protein
MTYNATAISYDSNGSPVSVEAVEVQGGQVVRGCGHWSSSNGTAGYQAVWLSGKCSFVTRIVVVRGTQVYRSAVAASLVKVLASSKLATLLTFQLN